MVHTFYFTRPKKKKKGSKAACRFQGHFVLQIEKPVLLFEERLYICKRINTRNNASFHEISCPIAVVDPSDSTVVLGFTKRGV
jgi:hypothetical protein